MAEKAEDDAATLRESIQRLRAYIYLNPVDKDSGATNASLKHRRTLQLELEETLYRLAEVVETHRVEEVARHAVDSGQAVVAMDIGRYVECPLCLDEMPGWYHYPFIKKTVNVTSFTCCGKVCCGKCVAKFDEIRNQARREALFRGNIASLLRPSKCPFCRTPQADDHGEVIEMLLGNAQAGRAWAQEHLGEECFNSWLATNDVRVGQEAFHWLTVAAQQGQVVAHFLLGSYWLTGNAAASIPPSATKAMESYRAAARHGHANAQYQYGKLLWNDNDYNHDDANALMWMTLAAAQGQPDAQIALGDYFQSKAAEDSNFEDAFKGMYWTRKAALIGDAEAQVDMVHRLPQIKMMLYDGEPHRAGYSCQPEVLFWVQQADPHITHAPSSWPGTAGKESCVQLCACCKKVGTIGGSSSRGSSDSRIGTFTNEIKIRKCAQCHAVGYCSKACQKKHWQMGHRVDCQKVTALKEEMKRAAQYPHLRFD